MIDKNFQQVGVYMANCLIAGCDAITAVPVNAFQRVAANPEESSVVTVPDLTNAWAHYNAVHMPAIGTGE